MIFYNLKNIRLGLLCVVAFFLLSSNSFAFEYTLEKTFLNNISLVKKEILYKSNQMKEAEKQTLLQKIYENKFDITLNTLQLYLEVLKNEEISKVYYDSNTQVIKFFNDKTQTDKHSFKEDEFKATKELLFAIKTASKLQNDNYKNALKAFEEYTKIKFSKTNLLSLLKQIQNPTDEEQTYEIFSKKPLHVKNAILHTIAPQDIKKKIHEYFKEKSFYEDELILHLKEYATLELKINQLGEKDKNILEFVKQKNLFTKVNKKVIQTKYNLYLQKCKIAFLAGDLLAIFKSPKKEISPNTQEVKVKAIKQKKLQPKSIKKEEAKYNFKHTTLKRIHFADASADVSSYSIHIIKRNAYLLSLMKDYRLELYGHSDNAGDTKANYELALQRAKNTKKALVSFGADGSKISTFSKGDSQPIATNKTQKGRLLNRRVEFKLIKKDD